MRRPIVEMSHWEFLEYLESSAFCQPAKREAAKRIKMFHSQFIAMLANRDQWRGDCLDANESERKLFQEREKNRRDLNRLKEALRDATKALGGFVDLNTNLRPAYEHPLSAYDRAMALLEDLDDEEKKEEPMPTSLDRITLLRQGLKARELPPVEVLIELSHYARFPEDWERGKLLQRDVGANKIPYKTEAEMGAGFWARLNPKTKPVAEVHGDLIKRFAHTHPNPQQIAKDLDHGMCDISPEAVEALAASSDTDTIRWPAVRDTLRALSARLAEVEKERGAKAESAEFWERCAVLNEKRFERAEAALATARRDAWDEGFSYRAAGGARQDNPHNLAGDNADG